MNLLWRIRCWLKSLLEAGSGQKKLFVEQLEDRCFLSAVPMNDGATVPVDPIPIPDAAEVDPLAERAKELSAEEEQLAEKEAAPEMSPLELPLWAKQRIAESAGEFVEAYRFGDQGIVVHYRDAEGDSEVLYRDASLVREVSLTEFIVDQLEVAGFGQQSVREIDDLNISRRLTDRSVETEIEGLATLESPDGTTRLLGFTLRLGTSVAARPSNAVPIPFPSRSPHQQPTDSSSTVNETKIEVVGPRPPKSLRDPIYEDFANRVQASFWVPPSQLLDLDGNENYELIPPQMLLPDPSMDAPVPSDDNSTTWQETPRQEFAEEGRGEVHDEAIFELNLAEDVIGDPLESVLDQEVESDVHSTLDDETLLPESKHTEESDSVEVQADRPWEQPAREESGRVRSPHRPRLDWPDAKTESIWPTTGEEDDADGGKSTRKSAHASDVNAFNRGDRSAATSEESDIDEAAEAEAGLPKSSGGSRQE